MRFFPFGSACTRVLAVLLSYLLLAQFQAALAQQQPPQPARQYIPDVSPSMNAENEIGRLATARAVIRDQDQQPIEGAAVAFELPEGGFFASDGSRKAEVKSGPNGEAASPAFCPVAAGSFDIQVTAGSGEGQNLATISQTNVRRFSRLAIGVLQGSGVTNYANLERTGAQRPTEPAVLVTDENNRPVACAEVSFQAPASGPGGAFAGEQPTVTLRTGADGRAAGAGFHPNSQPGDFAIAVSASLAGVEANARISQTIKQTSHVLAVTQGAGAADELGRLGGPNQIRLYDEFSKQPIPKAGVSFVLPENGSFLDGTRTAQAVTDANGQASPPAYCPLAAGAFPVSVIAATAEEQLRTTIARQAREPQFSKLVIQPIQGVNAVNDPKLKKATEPVVKITDDAGKPVACAAVTFQLPKTGAGGVFAGGQLTYQMRTGPDGQATGTGLVPNAQSGKFLITVSAALPPLTAGITVPQQNKGGHTGLVVALVVVAAAAGGGAAAMGGKSSTSSSGGGGGGGGGGTPTPVVISAGSASVTHP